MPLFESAKTKECSPWQGNLSEKNVKSRFAMQKKPR